LIIVLEVRKSKIEVLADFMSAGGQLASAQMVIFSLCPYMKEEVRELSEVISLKRVIP
jgi:hypothetical protein